MANNFREEVNQCLTVLKRGGLILYPTDTVWGIGCDATNSEAVEKVYQLKQRPDTKALICLVGDIAMLERTVAKVPDAAYDIINFSTKPTTIIYDAPKGIAENLAGSDNTLGIRVARDAFCRQVLKSFRRPLVSTSANLAGQPTPGSFSEIDGEILKGVDYIVPLRRQERNTAPSAIIRLGTDGTVKVIRK